MEWTMFWQVLPQAGTGWLGVFVVTSLIVAAVEEMNWLTDPEKREKDRNTDEKAVF